MQKTGLIMRGTGGKTRPDKPKNETDLDALGAYYSMFRNGGLDIARSIDDAAHLSLTDIGKSVGDIFPNQKEGIEKVLKVCGAF